MKKYLRFILLCFLTVFMFLVSDNKLASAESKIFTTNINLEKSDSQIAFDFNMPKDGKIRININVKDRGTVPGTLTFAIKTDYSNNSTKIKEITGITSTNGVNNLDVELTRGRYYFYYELSSADEDTVLGINCEAEILPTITDNISELSVHNINSFDDITDSGYDEIYFGDENQHMDLILPFKVDQAGGIIVSLKQAGSYDYLEAGLYQDIECTKPVGKIFKLDAIDNLVNIEREISKVGTYYIKFTYKNEDPNGKIAFKVKIYSISGGERNLSDGKTIVAYQASDQEKILYKINIEKTGLCKYIIIPYENSKGSGAYFQLLDKSKKKLTDRSYVVSQNYDDVETDAIVKYYTISKGTYYLEVNADCSIYQIKSVAYDISRQAGSSKTKARLLKSNGSIVEGYYTISDKTSKVDWYKFSIAKTGQYINFTIGYMLDGEIVFQILDSKGSILYDSSNEEECLEGAYIQWADYKYSKGTYYIKVLKGRKNSSFTYAIRIEK